MTALINNINNFINRDIEAQDESKTLAVLIRISSVILCIYMAGMGIASALSFYFPVILFYIVLFGILLNILYITYHGTIFRALIMLDAVVILLCVVGTWLYSWDSNFHSYIYFIMLAIFFYTKMNVRGQFTLASGNLAIVLLTAYLRYDVVGIYGSPLHAFVLNFLTLSALILAVGFSFASKFARTEYKLYQYNVKLKKLAGSDPLTGLMNRRNMLEIIAETLKRLQNGNDMMSVAIGDIDFFKKVNDSRGHECGDYVLKELSKLFEQFMETKGYAARWGGEEFLFVFTEGNGDHAFVEMETLRGKIEKMTFSFAEHEFKITMTFGLEEHDINEDIDETIRRADEKLYIGKESGRNKVVY